MTDQPRIFNAAGILLVEILLAIALAGMITLIVMTSFLYGRESTAVAVDRSRAAQIANLSLEAVHNIVQADYANLDIYSNDTTYYLDISGDQWVLTDTPTTIDQIFTPAITFSNGPNGSRQVSVNVSWEDSRNILRDVTATSYLTDWRVSQLEEPGNVRA